MLTLVASAIFVTMLLALCARTWRTFFLLVFPLWVVTTVYATYTILLGTVPGRAVALLLSGASWEEITGLFGMWQQKWLLLPIFGGADAVYDSYFALAAHGQFFRARCLPLFECCWC